MEAEPKGLEFTEGAPSPENVHWITLEVGVPVCLGKRRSVREWKRGSTSPELPRAGSPRNLPAKIADFEEFGMMNEISMSDALTGENFNAWMSAMARQASFMLKNTWVLFHRPKDEDIIGSRMVLRNKFKFTAILIKGRRGPSLKIGRSLQWNVCTRQSRYYFNSSPIGNGNARHNHRTVGRQQRLCPWEAARVNLNGTSESAEVLIRNDSPTVRKMRKAEEMRDGARSDSLRNPSVSSTGREKLV